MIFIKYFINRIIHKSMETKLVIEFHVFNYPTLHPE